MTRWTSLVVAAAVLQAACVSSTMIESVPSGAKVYVDGQYLGKAPATQRDTAIAGSSKTVLLKMECYRDLVGTIRKEEVKAGPLIAGILVAVPLLWVMGYPGHYVFELERDDASCPVEK